MEHLTNNGMTIQTFSNRTGLPSSTLRYYEKEGLIEPHVRSDNGYRYYHENQVHLALTIHSLRQTGVALKEIKQFINGDESDKAYWMQKWRHDIDSKMAALNVARQFLHGLEPEDEHIRLSKWSEPAKMLWFFHKVKRKRHPFQDVIEDRVVLLKQYKMRFYQEAYVKQDSMDDQYITGKIGFRLSADEKIPDHLLNGADVEIIQPTLFVSLDCTANDDYACFRLMLLLQSFGFEPSGPNMERYQLNDLLNYEWMVPVFHNDSQ